jgi:hypothetical protein
MGATEKMLCPCCGIEIIVGARDCSCGARFVGNPLDETPIQIQSFGPVMNTAALFVVVTAGVLVFTKWLALAGVLIIWSALRATRLARRERASYGGYRAAVAMLTVAVAASAVASGYGLAYIPRFLRNRETRQKAAISATFHHLTALLEEYKITYGSYPPNQQALTKAFGEALPTDYWGKSIGYKSYTAAIAEAFVTKTGIAITNFELRSSGPDEKMGTGDDIIMRDGIFITPEEDAKPIIKGAAGR